MNDNVIEDLVMKFMESVDLGADIDLEYFIRPRLQKWLEENMPPYPIMCPDCPCGDSCAVVGCEYRK